MTARPWPPDQLAADLARLGVVPGDLLLVHASLRRIGPAEGGAAGVVAALEQGVGPEGTLVMVLGAEDDFAWVNERPEPERAALLAEAPPFDARTTPAQQDVGTLAEVFRTLPGTHVSDHPEGRFGARGRLAPSLVADTPWHDYYGPGSVLERIVSQAGHVLRLGADLDTCTVLHCAEYLARVPGKRCVRRHRRVLTPDGPRILHVDCLDDTDGIVDRPGEDYFATILREYLATRPAQVGRVGGAGAERIEAADLVAFGARWMERNL